MQANSTLRQRVLAVIAQRHLLQHPFYLAWTQGELTQAHLRQYAEQYYQHVLAEPTYLSAVHSNTPHMTTPDNSGDISARQAILENLVDEERGAGNHIGLWKEFAFGLGATEQSLGSAQPLASTARLVDTFRRICREEPFYAGLAAMHAFESQVPAIAEAKIDGLKKFYGVTDPRQYAFFSVHREADVVHADTEWQLIARHAETPEAQEHVVAATREACDALWGFLDGVWETYCADMQCAAHVM